MKFRIGYRTIKTALGTTISILLAQAAGLDRFVSAGIITILCIKVTKRKSLRASWDRILACLIGMVFAGLFFEGIAYHPVIIGLLLLFFIPTVVIFKASDGIVTSSVIIIHVFSAGKITTGLILNELGILLIGVGVALIMNLYMPSLDDQLLKLQEKIENHFRKIMKEIISYLRTSENSWSGKELTETFSLLNEAKSLAFRDVENHFFPNENLYYHYFRMREKQLEVIERILPLVASLPLKVEQGGMIADFLEELVDNITPGDPPKNFLKRLLDMRTEFEHMELPKTREEFESRAALLQLTKEIEQYLNLKHSYKSLKKTEKRYRRGNLELR